MTAAPIVHPIRLFAVVEWTLIVAVVYLAAWHLTVGAARRRRARYRAWLDRRAAARDRDRPPPVHCRVLPFPQRNPRLVERNRFHRTDA